MILWLIGFIPNFFIHLLVFLGIIAFFSAQICAFISKFIPATLGFAPYYIIAKYIGLVVFILGIFLEGVVVSNSELKVEIDNQKLVIAQLQTKSAQVTTNTVIQYVDRIKTVQTKGDTIIKYVDRVITLADNKACTLPQGFYDSVNSGATNADVTNAVNGATK